MKPPPDATFLIRTRDMKTHSLFTIGDFKYTVGWILEENTLKVDSGLIIETRDIIGIQIKR